MITKFKIFEQSSSSLKRIYESDLYLFSNLNVGDYVLINKIIESRIMKIDNMSTTHDLRHSANYKVPSTYARIIKLAIIERNRFKYKILIFNLDIKPIELWIKAEDIIRKLTPDEILDFESKENVNKYNL